MVVSKNSETVHDYCREQNACARSRIRHCTSEVTCLASRLQTEGVFTVAARTFRLPSSVSLFQTEKVLNLIFVRKKISQCK